MSKIIIYHNPRCSKSRAALKLLNEKNQDPEIFLYLQDILSQSKIRRCFAESTDQAPETAGANLWVFNPAVSGNYSQVLYQNSSYYGGSYGTSYVGFGLYKVLGTMTGFNAYEANGSRPLASGTFRTYGLRVDK